MLQLARGAVQPTALTFDNTPKGRAAYRLYCAAQEDGSAPTSSGAEPPEPRLKKKPAAPAATGQRLEAGKGIKFNQLKREGKLPPYIVELYNSQGSEGNARAARTSFIEKLLTKNAATGCWCLNLQDPTFRDLGPSF